MNLLKVATLLMSLLLMSCSSITSLAGKQGLWTEERMEYPKARLNFGGVKYNLAEIKWKNNQPDVIPLTIFANLIDTPLCCITDIVALPYTLIVNCKDNKK